MEKELFYNEIKDRVEKYYGEKAVVSESEVTKNNGLIKRALCVKIKGSNCAPTLYIDDFYGELNKGRSIDEIAQDIISVFEKHEVTENVDMSFFTDFDSISDKICFKIVNRDRNKERLESMPHRIIEDLAITYYVSLTAIGIDGVVQIRNAFLDLWNIDEEGLFEAALENTPRLYPESIISMAEFLKERTGDNLLADMLPDEYMLIASNDKYMNGATVMLYPGLLEKIGERFGTNFYIIPSSVHELILLKDIDDNHEAKELLDMVKCVNSTCVSSEDILADSLYYYDRTIENNIKKVEQVKATML